MIHFDTFELGSNVFRPSALVFTGVFGLSDYSGPSPTGTLEPLGLERSPVDP
jgi:hypothetical protein